MLAASDALANLASGGIAGGAMLIVGEGPPDFIELAVHRILRRTDVQIAYTARTCCQWPANTVAAWCSRVSRPSSAPKHQNCRRAAICRRLPAALPVAAAIEKCCATCWRL